MLLHDGPRYVLERDDAGQYTLTGKDHGGRKVVVPEKVVRQTVPFSEDGSINTDGIMLPGPYIDFLLESLDDYLAPDAEVDFPLTAATEEGS